MRIAYYAGASTAAAAACLVKAFSQRPNFYSATVYLSQSNACLLMLTNLLLVLAFGFMCALQRLLYGPLRPIEIEQLSEKAWYAVLDTLLAMPSFREDVGGWLLTMFVLLMAAKVWGWIAEGRVDVLEQQPPANPTLFHIRLSTSLLLSVAFALSMLKYSVESVIDDPRPGMMVIFTFEFAILSIFSTFTCARYGLALVDATIVKKQLQDAIHARKSEIRAERAAARETARGDGRELPRYDDDEPIEVDENEVDVPGWEEKRRYLFVLEVVTDFIKLVIYITFFTVSVTFNGLPMHIMRDVYMTFASFSKRITDFMAYRRATSEMNTRYPDATTEEIQGDACIVCRESMVAWAAGEPQADVPVGGQPPAAPAPARRRDEGLRAKKLPCGHILHMRCLKSWLERQQVCPTCRRPVVSANSPASAGAGAGNAGQPGQPGQPPAARPRGRIFNLGPLRLGLVNAPAGQMRNIMNQLQNPGAAPVQNANANEGAAAAAPAALPGLPSLPGQAPRMTGLRAQLPTHVQLAHLEHRLVQEAHNLGVTEQQLATVRLLENELARLRALRLPVQQQQQQQPPQPQPGPLGQVARFPMPGFAPQHGVLQIPQLQVDVLRGAPTQHYGNGHESLPQGLVLPEGWTAMPLQRAGAIAPPASQARTAQEPTATASSTTQSAAATRSVVMQSPMLADPVSSAAQTAEVTAPPAEQPGHEAQGPTDARGSPLFVPANPVTAPSSTLRSQAQGIAETNASNASPRPASTLTEVAAESVDHPEPWGGSNWSFDAPATEPQQVASTQGPSESSRERHSEISDSVQSESYGGKGKGKARAVEVEDAPDPEA